MSSLCEPLPVWGWRRQQPRTGTKQAHFLFMGPRHGNSSAPPVQTLSAKAEVPFCQVFQSSRMFGEGWGEVCTCHQGAFPPARQAGCSPCPDALHSIHRAWMNFFSMERQTRWYRDGLECKVTQTCSKQFPALSLNISFLWTFSSSPSKTEKTQLNWRGLSELHFVYQGQRTQELNKTALYETEKTKIANQR